MQVVLDTFRLGGRPSPYDEYCQPAKHKDREAEAERDPADRIEHIRPAVRNVPRADDAEGQCGQQIEHKQFEPVLVTSYNNNYGIRRGSQPLLFPSQSRSC